MEQIKQKIEQAKVWKESRKKWKGFEQIYMFSESELLELLKEMASDSYGAGFVASYDNSKEDFSDFWSDFLTNIEQDEI